jgi:hypothetical protein
LDQKLSRPEIIAAARAAGLDLPEQFHDDLVVAYERVQRLLVNLPSGRPRGDEPAHVFDPTKFLPLGDL